MWQGVVRLCEEQETVQATARNVMCTQIWPLGGYSAKPGPHVTENSFWQL